jgi:aminoglycoside phosphotransferase (APT) family kinase protein
MIMGYSRAYTPDVGHTAPVTRPGEVRAEDDQVRRLIATQFPEWADLPVRPGFEAGTDHRLFRLGDDLLVRMPRIEVAADQAESDRRWLPVLARYLPVPIPVPVAVGVPGEGFPWPWSVVPWLPGVNPVPGNFDMERTAVQLAEFVLALRRADTFGGPLKTGTYRGVPLAARDELTRAAIAELGDRVDGVAVTKAWDRAMAVAPWAHEPVWVHGDLMTGNLLVRERRLAAVIDFGALGLGDPAVDLMPAWNLLNVRGRRVFREALGCDDDMWERGRGWVLTAAIGGMPHYWDMSPAIVAEAFRDVAAVLSET